MVSKSNALHKRCLPLAALRTFQASSSMYRLLAPGAACCLAATSILSCQAHNSADMRSSDAQLELVQVIFRHGARSPLTTKYWDGIVWEKGKDCGEKFRAVQISLQDPKGSPAPHNSWDQKQVETVWPGGCSKGELTLAGQQQAFNFGSWLRQRYIDQLDLLPENYKANVVISRSTNYARTKETLKGVLTGLYDTQEVIPVMTATETDEILIGSYQCTHLTGLLKLQTEILKGAARDDPRVGQLDKDCREALSLKDEEPVAYTDLYDALTTRQFHSKGWPKGMTESLYRRIEEEALKRMAAIVSPLQGDKLGPNILKLSSGQLFRELSLCMDKATNGSAEKNSKMLLYSGHDTTIMPVLASLVGDLERWPPYLSNVVIELWKRGDSGEGEDAYFVTAFYNCEPLELNPDKPGIPLSLKEFKRRFWDPHSIGRDEFLAFCKKEVHRPKSDVPNIGGDAVQGL